MIKIIIAFNYRMVRNRRTQTVFKHTIIVVAMTTGTTYKHDTQYDMILLF